MSRRAILDEEDRLDRIAATIYGTEGAGTVEALLEANPGLAALGLMIPAGTSIVVPDAPVPAAPVAVRPWL